MSDDSQTPTTDGIDEINDTVALAVNTLADAIGPDTYRGEDVAEAKAHLRTALENAPADSETADRIATALGGLDDMGQLSLGEREGQVRHALAELAPVAAGVDADRVTGRPTDPLAKSEDERPTVPVFYHLPPAVVDRAAERFQRRVEAERAGDAPEEWAGQTARLRDYIYEEIAEMPVMYVGDEPLGEYAAGRVDCFEVDLGD